MNLQGNIGCPCAEFVSACGKRANYNRRIDEAASIYGASHATPSAFLFLLVVDGEMSTEGCHVYRVLQQV